MVAGYAKGILHMKERDNSTVICIKKHTYIKLIRIQTKKNNRDNNTKYLHNMVYSL